MNNEQNETYQTIPAPDCRPRRHNSRVVSKPHKDRNGSCQFLEERFRRHNQDKGD